MVLLKTVASLVTAGFLTFLAAVVGKVPLPGAVAGGGGGLSTSRASSRRSGRRGDPLLSRHITRPAFSRFCSILGRLGMVGVLFSWEAWTKNLSFSRGISGEMGRVPRELVWWCRA